MLASHPANRPVASDVVAEIDALVDSLSQQELVRSRRTEIVNGIGAAPRPLPADFRQETEAPRFAAAVVAFLGILVAGAFGLIGAWPLSAVVFAVACVAAGALLFQSHRTRRLCEFYVNGAIAVGRIEGTVSTEGDIEKGRVYYSFEVDGERRQGDFSTAGEPPERGAPIVVVFEPGRPSRHRPLPALLDSERLI